ncbi:MAG: hypothetical protein HW401_401 [Parcubacteria group bacterium]|nr:hypothetical protein [Parcubacteria group bacterium]
MFPIPDEQQSGEFWEDYYKLLPNGKRVVKWNSYGVYLNNLETEMFNILYTVPQNQSIVSSEGETEVGNDSTYDIKVEENQVTVGVYDKNKFQDNKIESGYSVKNYTLINRITIPIPSDQSYQR